MKLFDPTLLSSVGASAVHALMKRGPLDDDASPTHYECDCGTEEADKVDPWRKGFTRRRLMQGGGMVLAAPLAQQLVTTRMAFAQTPGAATKRVVIVGLRGGCDGLNMVVPHGDGSYYNVRSGIAVPRNQLLKADGMFGLNPALGALAPFWDSGQFAAVHGVAMTEPNYSHFQATREYEQASNGSGGSGWLNRTLESLGLVGSASTAFQAAQIGGETPFSLRGAAPTVTLDRLEDFRLTANEPAQFSETLATLYNSEHPVSQPVRNALDALQLAGQITAEEYTPAGEYTGDGGFAGALQQLARIIKADIGMVIGTVEVGGWDTHTDMGNGGDADGNFNEHVKYLGDNLAAFLTDLGPELANTTVITTSEFGRQVYQNDNGGTDHGWANAMLVMGGGVNGGRYFANWPGLDNDEDGSLAKGYDYRDLMAGLITNRLGVANLGTVFPNYTYEDRGVFRQG